MGAAASAGMPVVMEAGQEEASAEERAAALDKAVGDRMEAIEGHIASLGMEDWS